MKTRTAVLILICVLSYHIGNLTESDRSAVLAYVTGEARSFAADPIDYVRLVIAHLEATGGLRFIVLGVCAKAFSWHFARRRKARLAAVESRAAAKKAS